mmetsp:Transcript_31643/g.106564  ORF Transcript_31643/g.106564 Transcript_31643/m.106564 type:complete len:216 (+) Transcript_31643:178-825(+)
MPAFAKAHRRFASSSEEKLASLPEMATPLVVAGTHSFATASKSAGVWMLAFENAQEILAMSDASKVLMDLIVFVQMCLNKSISVIDALEPSRPTLATHQAAFASCGPRQWSASSQMLAVARYINRCSTGLESFENEADKVPRRWRTSSTFAGWNSPCRCSKSARTAVAELHAWMVLFSCTCLFSCATWIADIGAGAGLRASRAASSRESASGTFA